MLPNMAQVGRTIAKTDPNQPNMTPKWLPNGLDTSSSQIPKKKMGGGSGVAIKYLCYLERHAGEQMQDWVRL